MKTELYSRHLPSAADIVLGLHADLRSVKCAAAFVEHEREAFALRGVAQGRGGFVPFLVGPRRLAGRLGRELEVEVVEAVVAQYVEHEVEQRRELACHLLLRAEDVRVVLRETAHSRE